MNVSPEMNQDLQNSDFTCAAFTSTLPKHPSGLIIVGTADGAVAAVDRTPKDMNNPGKLEWQHKNGKKEYVMPEAISSIIYNFSHVVIAGAMGTVIRYEDYRNKKHVMIANDLVESTSAMKVLSSDDSLLPNDKKEIYRIMTE